MDLRSWLISGTTPGNQGQSAKASVRVRVRTARTVEREGMTINVSSLLQTHSAKIFN